MALNHEYSGFNESPTSADGAGRTEPRSKKAKDKGKRAERSRPDDYLFSNDATELPLHTTKLNEKSEELANEIPLWVRIIRSAKDKKPDEDRVETKIANEKDEVKADGPSEKASEDVEVEKPLTFVEVRDRVLEDPDYVEIEEGNLNKSAVDYVGERVPVLDRELAEIPPEDTELRKYIEADRAFLNEVGEALARPLTQGSEQAEPPKLNAAIEKAFANAWRLSGMEEADVDAPVSEALDDQTRPNEDGKVALAQEGHLTPGLVYEDVDDLQSTRDASGNTHQSYAAYGAGSPPGSGYGPPVAGGAGYHAGDTANFNAAAQIRNFEITDPTEDARNAIAGTALLAGVIGYFIGKHRGTAKERKKGVANELQLQQKIEIKEIETKVVRSQLAAKERQFLRKSMEHTNELAAAKAAGSPSASSEMLAGRTVQYEAATATVAQKPLFERIAESAPLAVPIARSSEAAQANSSASRSEMAASVAAAERVPNRPPGLQEHQDLRPNAIQMRSPESASQVSIGKLEAPSTFTKPVETMTQKELIEVAEKIVVGGETIAQIFIDSKEIGEPSLRRIVAEYQRGGDVSKTLFEEKVRSSYERDPGLRSRSLPYDPGISGASQKAEQEQEQPQQALPSGLKGNEPLLSPTPRHPLLIAHDESPVPSALIIANIVAFVILAILFLVWLLFIH